MSAEGSAPTAAAGVAAGGFDARTVATVQKLPLLSETAGPRDAKEKWEARLKQELQALIQYIQANKAADSDWFTIAPEKPPAAGSSAAAGAATNGLRWAGKCWYVHNYVRHEFAFRFDVPAAYPLVAPEIEIPELEGKTAKMYRGGKICLTIHFKPLWARNAPHFGFAHALCLGLAPWLAAEVPFLIESGAIAAKN